MEIIPDHRPIKAPRKPLQRHPGIRSEIHRQKIIEEYIGYNSRIPTEIRASQTDRFLYGRMTVGEIVDFPVQQNALPETGRIPLIRLAFHGIPDKITDLHPAVAPGQKDMCQIIHRPAGEDTPKNDSTLPITLRESLSIHCTECPDTRSQKITCSDPASTEAYAPMPTWSHKK